MATVHLSGCPFVNNSPCLYIFSRSAPYLIFSFVNCKTFYFRARFNCRLLLLLMVFSSFFVTYDDDDLLNPRLKKRLATFVGHVNVVTIKSVWTFGYLFHGKRVEPDNQRETTVGDTFPRPSPVQVVCVVLLAVLLVILLAVLQLFFSTWFRQKVKAVWAPVISFNGFRRKQHLSLCMSYANWQDTFLLACQLGGVFMENMKEV